MTIHTYPKQNYPTAAREVWDCLDTAFLLRGAFRETTSLPEIEAVIRKACDLIEDPNDPAEGSGEDLIDTIEIEDGVLIATFCDLSMIVADEDDGLTDLAATEEDIRQA